MLVIARYLEINMTEPKVFNIQEQWTHLHDSNIHQPSDREEKVEARGVKDSRGLSKLALDKERLA